MPGIGSDLPAAQVSGTAEIETLARRFIEATAIDWDGKGAGDVEDYRLGPAQWNVPATLVPPGLQLHGQ